MSTELVLSTQTHNAICITILDGWSLHRLGSMTKEKQRTAQNETILSTYDPPIVSWKANYSIEIFANCSRIHSLDEYMDHTLKMFRNAGTRGVCLPMLPTRAGDIGNRDEGEE